MLEVLEADVDVDMFEAIAESIDHRLGTVHDRITFEAPGKRLRRKAMPQPELERALALSKSHYALRIPVQHQAVVEDELAIVRVGILIEVYGHSRGSDDDRPIANYRRPVFS